jgi:hypothetical protein
MLAQNFKTADDLDITEKQKDALCKTLVLFETGKLTHVPPSSNGDEEATFSGHFNMCNWSAKHRCGTIGCIGGTAEMVGQVSFGYIYGLTNLPLKDLFLPNEVEPSQWGNITVDQASRALRSYLTTGAARWDLAVA